MSRFWMVAMLLLGGLIYWGVSSLLSINDGDAEFKQMMEATEHVKSFRAVDVEATATGRLEKLWEVDCNRNVIRKRSQTSPTDVTEDQLLVGIDRYNHDTDGSWVKTADKHVLYSGQWYCDNLAQGTL